MKVRERIRKNPTAAYKGEEVKSPWCWPPENPAFEKREDRGSLKVVVSARKGRPAPLRKARRRADLSVVVSARKGKPAPASFENVVATLGNAVARVAEFCSDKAD
jgi:hypothetical protein